MAIRVYKRDNSAAIYKKAEQMAGLAIILAVCWWHVHDWNRPQVALQQDLARQHVELLIHASELEATVAKNANPSLSWYENEMRKRPAIVTAYSCGGIKTAAERLMNCPNGVTASGTIPSSGRTVACPHSMIGKRITIQGIGTRYCEDTGGAITDGRIDLYVDDIAEAMQFGKRHLTYVVQ